MRNMTRPLGTLLLSAAVACGWLNAAIAASYEQRPEAKIYIERLVQDHQFDRQFLVQIFSGAKKQKYAIQAMDSPAERKPWHEYKKMFVTPSHVLQGVDFYHRNAELLKKIEGIYQVPAEIIIAIVGIETRYGANMGSFPVLDTLITLSFDYPRRAEFFRRQLTEMLLLMRDEKLDYRNLKGSYAGAMGIGQFIPSSYRSYAVDFDQDGRRNLWGSLPDALASIANYLHSHGWQKETEIATRLNEQAALKTLPFNKQLKPWLTIAELEQTKPAVQLNVQQPQFSLFSYLGGKNNTEYWATYYNFYVISRYNRSALYTMAVYQLSQAIKTRYAVDAEVN